MDSKFKVFVISAFVVLFAGMVAGGFFIFKSVSSKDPATETKEVQSPPKDVAIFEIAGDITTNLISEKNEQNKHVIKVTVGFAVDKKSKDFKKVSEDFIQKEILIRNEVIQALRDQPYESMAKPDAQAKLAEIIVPRVSTLLFTESIEEMYFGDFFVQ